MRRSAVPLLALLVPYLGCSSKGGTSNVDAAAAADLAVTYYAPAGYALTPFLSTDPVRTFAKADQVLTAGHDYLAVIETDVGRVVLDLTEADTPITVNSFVWLALHHYFDGLAFHRVVPGFVVQGGDPSSVDPDPNNWTDGDPGYSFGLEVVPSLKFSGAGILGMARTNDPNSNGSQFFITLAAASSLDGKYTVFGKTIEGADVLTQIAPGSPPAKPTRMTRVYIVEK
jgi:peptidylprolyl isomerase